MKNFRSIGIDYGNARIGISYSDASKLIAAPLAVVKASRKSDATIRSIIDVLAQHQKELNYEIDTIVVGLPLMMSGLRGLMADEVEFFISKLKIAYPEVTILTWDERLSSVQADRSMREANFSRRKRSKFVDTVSAVIILQNYLDSLKFKNDLLPPLPPIV